MAEGYISKQECACGCQTLLPTHLVRRGWRYLRGHKPKQQAAVSAARADASGTARQASFGGALQMAHLALAEAEQQLRACDAAYEAATERKRVAELAHCKVQAVVRALERLMGVAPTHDASGEKGGQ